MPISKKFLKPDKWLWVLMSVIVLLVSSCARGERAGELTTESETVALEGADRVVAEVTMGAGDLQVSGGADALLEADFTYNIDVWKPRVDYSVNESGGENIGRLFVSQPADVDFDPDLTNFRYEWDLILNNDVPMELRIELGAGNSTFDVGGLNLTALDIAAGAGNIMVDLSGARQSDLVASIRGGVGNLTVLLPEEAGVKVDVTGGLGQVVAAGLRQDEDGAFVNEAFDTAENTLIIDITGGVGEVNLEVVQ